MNVLFLTLYNFETLQEKNLYTDLLREFVKHGHNVYAISPLEKRFNKETHLNTDKNAQVLRLQIGNVQKTGAIEKGISTIMIEHIYKKAIKKFFSSIVFDLILYSTPPITLVGAIEYVKRRDGAKTYLLLKDIFPQNAVDIGMMKTTGLIGLQYKYFRWKEKRLYRVSDRIGCMSEANAEYLVNHNPEININNVEVCPNCIEVNDHSIDDTTKKAIREKYGIPSEKTVFVYGGNLGKPQGIPFLIECLRQCKKCGDVFFLIVGDGTEYHLLKEYIEHEEQKNLKLLKLLPKEDYELLVGACDVGIILLDYRFTIPNFPYRLFAYMQAKLPVLAVTDPYTDVGQVVLKGKFGWWCESKDSSEVEKTISIISLESKERLRTLGENGYQYLRENYEAKAAFEKIMSFGNR